MKVILLFIISTCIFAKSQEIKPYKVKRTEFNFEIITELKKIINLSNNRIIESTCPTIELIENDSVLQIDSFFVAKKDAVIENEDFSQAICYKKVEGVIIELECISYNKDITLTNKKVYMKYSNKNLLVCPNDQDSIKFN